MEREEEKRELRISPVRSLANLMIPSLSHSPDKEEDDDNDNDDDDDVIEYLDDNMGMVGGFIHQFYPDGNVIDGRDEGDRAGSETVTVGGTPLTVEFEEKVC